MQSPLDFNRNFSYMPQGYQHNILDEDYESTTELKKLAEEIVNIITDKNYKEYSRYREFDFIRGLDLSEIDSSQYNKLQDFINNLNLKVMFPDNDSGKKGEFHGFESHRKKNYKPSQKQRVIKIFYPYEYLKNRLDGYIMRQFNEGNFNRNDIYVGFKELFFSPIIHELQHAYDEYRSGSMYTKTKETKKYDEKYMNKNVVSDLNKFKHIKFKEYVNLPHEIWAFFTEAIIRTIENTDTSISLSDFVNKFKQNFQHFHLLKPKGRKKLINKAAQFWHYRNEKK